MSINSRSSMEYIYCSHSWQMLRTLNTGSGFTISLLIKRSGNLNESQVYMAYGGKNQPPVYKFRKVMW